MQSLILYPLELQLYQSATTAPSPPSTTRVFFFLSSLKLKLPLLHQCRTSERPFIFYTTCSPYNKLDFYIPLLHGRWHMQYISRNIYLDILLISSLVCPITVRILTCSATFRPLVYLGDTVESNEIFLDVSCLTCHLTTASSQGCVSQNEFHTISQIVTWTFTSISFAFPSLPTVSSLLPTSPQRPFAHMLTNRYLHRVIKDRDQLLQHIESVLKS